MNDLIHAQADYVIFAAAMVAVFAGIAYALRQRRPDAGMPTVTWAILALVLSTGWWPVQRSSEAERDKLEALVASMAPTYARELARAGHEQIAIDTPADDPALLRIRGMIDDWLRLNHAVADIYTMRARADGKRVFLVDTDTDTDRDGQIGEDETGAKPGEVFDEEDAGLERALRGEANFNPEIVNDRWGSWVGAWAPIFGADARVEAVVGIDFDARDWARAIEDARRGRILQLGLLLAMVGAAMGAIGLLRADVARRRRAEEESATSANRLRLTIEQMPLAFLEVAPSGVIVAWNPAATEIFGYTREEVEGKMHLEIIVAPADRPRVRELIAALMRGSADERNVNDNVTRDGCIIRCEWFNAPVIGASGEVLSIMCLAQDITVRLNLEEQLRQSQRMTAIGQLAAGVAHDFNNLLTVIQGHVHLLLDRTDLAPDAREDAERISTASDRAGHLTRQLLSFSRKQPLFLRPVEMNVSVRAAAHLLERTLGAGVRVQCELAGELPAIEADPAMLDQVITNLAVNARDAMPGGGMLTFSTDLVVLGAEQTRGNPERRAGRFVRLRVRDTGEGIEAAVLPRIFEPFFTTKEVGKGTGLGLAAVHGIVKQHSGWIEVESSCGRGTTFAIHLPASDRAISPEPQPHAAIPGGVADERMTVLLVEDDETVRYLARISLERAGYRVLEAADGHEAERTWAMHRSEIGAVVTDLVMPHGMSGRELADRLVAERPGLPVVYASGYSVESTAPDFAESPTQTFLQKPYVPVQLIAALRSVVNAQGR